MDTLILIGTKQVFLFTFFKKNLFKQYLHIYQVQFNSDWSVKSGWSSMKARGDINL